MKHLIARFAFFYLLTTVFGLSLLSAQASQSELPMSQFNFQGFVPESRHERGRDEPADLIRLAVDPDLEWVLHRVIDRYQENSQRPFRIHVGHHQQVEDFLDDGEVFDIIISGRMRDAHQFVRRGLATESRVWAVGRVALWAPLETVRSTSVLRLQNQAIGLPPATSPYHQAALDILERHEMLEEMQPRLQEVSPFQNYFELIRTREIPIGFLPYQRTVEGGVAQQRAVLKMQANHHAPVIHAATLMRAGQNREEVALFWAHLFGPATVRILREAGLD